MPPFRHSSNASLGSWLVGKFVKRSKVLCSPSLKIFNNFFVGEVIPMMIKASDSKLVDAGNNQAHQFMS